MRTNRAAWARIVLVLVALALIADAGQLIGRNKESAHDSGHHNAKVKHTKGHGSKQASHSRHAEKESKALSTHESSVNLAACQTGSNVLGQGDALCVGGFLQAGNYRLIMQGDGNLVNYFKGSTAVWNSATDIDGSTAEVQDDATLAVIQPAVNAVTGTCRNVMPALQDLGSINFLDRSNSFCNVGEVMTRWYLSRSNAQYRVEFTCCSLASELKYTDNALATPWQDAGGWAMVFMDRLDPNCRNNGGWFRGWRYNSCANNCGWGTAAQIAYSCERVTNTEGFDWASASCSMYYTPWNDYSERDLVFLDRHNVGICPAGTGMTLWKLETSYNPNKIRIRYECCSLNRPRLTKWSSSNPAPGSRSNSAVLLSESGALVHFTNGQAFSSPACISSARIFITGGQALCTWLPAGALTSPSGNYRLTVNVQGQMVLSRADGTAVWTKGAPRAGTTQAMLSLARNSELFSVVFGDRTEARAWSERGRSGLTTTPKLELTDDGSLVHWDEQGTFWSTGPAVAGCWSGKGKVLSDQQVLCSTGGDSLVSGDFTLAEQEDGNLVMSYTRPSPAQALWASGSPRRDSLAGLQADGSLAVTTRPFYASTGCRDAFTAWQDGASSGFNFLDRTRMQCDAGEAMARFQMETSGSTYRYAYTCCRLADRVAPADSLDTTAWQDAGGWRVAYLDRHVASCKSKAGGNSGFLRGWYVNTGSNVAGFATAASVSYSCTTPAAELGWKLSCTTMTTTPFATEDTLGTLQRHDVSCPGGSALASAQLVPVNNGASYQYRYECCSMSRPPTTVYSNGRPAPAQPASRLGLLLSEAGALVQFSAGAPFFSPACINGAAERAVLKVGESLCTFGTGANAAKLASANGKFVVTLLTDGTLTIGTRFRTFWRRSPDQANANFGHAMLTLGQSGDLLSYVLGDRAEARSWVARGRGSAGANLQLTIGNDGNLVLADSAGLVWQSDTVYMDCKTEWTTAPAGCATDACQISPLLSSSPEAVLCSPNGLYTLRVQDNGDSVLYCTRDAAAPNWKPYWNVGTAGSAARALSLANLSPSSAAAVVSQDPSGNQVWMSGTRADRPCPGLKRLALQDDGNLVAYCTQSGAAFWSSRTAGFTCPA